MKNMEDGAWGISRLAFSASAFFLASISPESWFFLLESVSAGAQAWWSRRGGEDIQAGIASAWGSVSRLMRKIKACQWN